MEVRLAEATANFKRNNEVAEDTDKTEKLTRFLKKDAMAKMQVLAKVMLGEQVILPQAQTPPSGNVKVKQELIGDSPTVAASSKSSLALAVGGDTPAEASPLPADPAAEKVGKGTASGEEDESVNEKKAEKDKENLSLASLEAAVEAEPESEKDKEKKTEASEEAESEAEKDDKQPGEEQGSQAVKELAASADLLDVKTDNANDDSSGGQKGSETPATLAEALSFASKVHGIGFPQHVRNFTWMADFHDKVADHDEEKDFEKSRLV